MQKVTSVSKLKAQLSAYLEYVKSGEEIIVTDRGKPIARVSPLVSTPDDVHLQRLIAQGLARPGNGKSPRELLANWTLVDTKASLVDALLEEREEGR